MTKRKKYGKKEKEKNMVKRVMGERNLMNF